MKYFLIKSFNPKVSFDDLVLELDDPNNNSWLINYGIHLDVNKNYFNIKFYGEENILKEQSILNIENVFLFNKELRDFWKSTVGFENIEWLDVEIYNSNSKKISHSFKIMNFIKIIDCINWESSSFDLFDEDEKRYIFYSVIVKKEINKYLIGNIDGLKGIFINEQIRIFFDKKKFKSLAFKELIIDNGSE